MTRTIQSRALPAAAILLCAGLALAAAAPSAHAQLSASGGPISYSADNLEYTDNQRQLVLTGNVDVVKALVDRGANLNAQSKDGWTALMSAAEKGDGKSVEYMVAHGADVTKVNFQYGTAQIFAEVAHHPEVAAMLERAASAKSQRAPRPRSVG